MDAWVNGKCTPASQPSAMTDANGEVKSWRRFCEIPCFNTVLGTRLFNFDGVGTYKSAQSIVAQWLEKDLIRMVLFSYISIMVLI